MKRNIPSDLKQGNVIQAGDDKFFHLPNGCHVPHGMESIFHCTPILLNKIQFTVILWVKVTEMAMQLNKFLNL